MKNTPFTELHIQNGAKMHEFAGYNMPIEFSGILDEHQTVLNGVGVFDVSHMGEFWVKGPKAVEYLQKITSNDVTKLQPGKAHYTCFVNEIGGIVDDFILYHYEPEKFLMVVNAANIDKDWEWCQRWNTEDVEIENASNNIALLAVQGPKAVETLQKLTEVDLSTIPSYSFVTTKFAGVDNVILSNTGYTGAGGFELYFYPENGLEIWDGLFESGAEIGIKPIGLGARDTLRLEMGYCLYGNELNDSTTPLESGLGWITKFVDDKPFIGREILEKQKSKGVENKLCCFELIDKGIPRQGYDIVNNNEEIIGNVTSGTMSPTLKKGIGMGYVKTKYAKPGNEIAIKVRNRILKAEVVKPPFRT